MINILKRIKAWFKGDHAEVGVENINTKENDDE